MEVIPLSPLPHKETRTSEDSPSKGGSALKRFRSEPRKKARSHRPSSSANNKETSKSNVKSIVLGKKYTRTKAKANKRSDDIIEIKEHPLRKRSVEFTVEDTVKLDSSEPEKKRVKLKGKSSRKHDNVDLSVIDKDEKKASNKQRNLFFDDADDKEALVNRISHSEF
jgi:hypothetical protein